MGSQITLMDTIGIDNLLVQGIHGHYEHEWERPQSFRVSMEVLLNTQLAGSTDTLSNTIDYDILRDSIVRIFAGERRALIETLAEEIAAEALKDVRVQEVRLTICKLDAWKNGVPRISITRTREV